MAREVYRAQVDLLVRALRVVARESSFALKGGTAINLFHRDMPRLSVDIDLTWLPVEERREALANIDAALRRVQNNLEAELRGVQVRVAEQGDDKRLLVRQGNAEIKIETSPVMRGTVHEPQLLRLVPRAEEEFGFAEMQVVAFTDLYAGKLVAALDRQHPRDLFDVHQLYRFEGVSDELFRAFLVYVASSNRPPHELLQPTPLDISAAFHAEFEGMTTESVALAELLGARERLVRDIQGRLNGPVLKFLLALHDGDPDFKIIGLPQAAELPAVRWKLLNLRKLRESNQEKHALQRAAIKSLAVSD